jgi:site-specific recombinase XerC
VTSLAPTLEAFFTDRLARQRAASAHTVAAYRDTFRLLVGFAQARIGKAPCRLDLADLDAPLIGAFLDHLEADRHNSVRTRNAAWPLSTRCSATPPSATPSTPPSSNGSSPSPPNATTAPP